jgi:hypothetical protein
MSQLSEVVKTKTIKTPLMTSEAYGPTSFSSCLVPKSTLLPKPEVQYVLLRKLSRHAWQKHRYRSKTAAATTLVRLMHVFPAYGSNRCFSGSSEPRFLLFSGCHHIVMDGGSGGFYLCAITQGKDCRHDIGDEGSTRKKSCYGFC